MFARATSGDKINNRKFSPCSLKSIKPVLLSKAIGKYLYFKKSISRKKFFFREINGEKSISRKKIFREIKVYILKKKK